MWHWKFRQIELLYCVLQIHKSLSVKGVILGQTPRSLSEKHLFQAGMIFPNFAILATIRFWLFFLFPCETLEADHG
jgi:hypothetical protein